MNFVRDEHKNTYIKARPGSKGIGFEAVEDALLHGQLMFILPNDNPRYKDQEMRIVKVNGYPYKVPIRYLDQDTVLLITAYPYRKFT